MTYGIAYQNKDILFKILSEHYKNKSLNIYGLDLPPIKEVLPANLPSIQLDEKRADNVFLLEDDTILILEYESSSSYKNLIKYCHYAFRVSESYFEDKIHKLILVTIYTGDIEQAPDFLDLGCIKLQVEQVFLTRKSILRHIFPICIFHKVTVSKNGIKKLNTTLFKTRILHFNNTKNIRWKFMGQN